jgi:hypothetical protein
VVVVEALAFYPQPMSHFLAMLQLRLALEALEELP